MTLSVLVIQVLSPAEASADVVETIVTFEAADKANSCSRSRSLALEPIGSGVKKSKASASSSSICTSSAGGQTATSASNVGGEITTSCSNPAAG